MSTAMSAGFSLAHYVARVNQIDTTPTSGRVIRTVGLLIESAGPRASVGEICEVIGNADAPPLPVQVVGFREGTLLTVPLGDTAGVRPGDRIVARAGAVSVGVGPARRHQQAMVRDKRCAPEKIGTFAQCFCGVGGLSTEKSGCRPMKVRIWLPFSSSSTEQVT